MAITTLDGATSNQTWSRYFAKTTTSIVADRPNSSWGLGSSPGAGSYDTTLNGVTLTAPQTGQINFTNPASGNSYLARLQAQTSTSGILYLCDRLWHNGGYTITSTSAQNSTTPTWPARDIAGATAGDGVFLGLEISAAAGAAAPTITIAYTNQAGSGSKSATNIDATANSPGLSTFYRIGLQAGDTGVRSVQSLTLNTSWLSGTMNLVAYRPIAALEMGLPGTKNAIDVVTGGFPQIYDSSVLFFIMAPISAVTLNISGFVTYSQG